MLQHMFSPLSYFIFSIHTKFKSSKRQAKLIQTTIEDKQGYLLVKVLFAWNLLPPDTILQGFTKQQLQWPLFDKLVVQH